MSGEMAEAGTPVPSWQLVAGRATGSLHQVPVEQELVGEDEGHRLRHRQKPVEVAAVGYVEALPRPPCRAREGQLQPRSSGWGAQGALQAEVRQQCRHLREAVVAAALAALEL